MKHIYVSDMWSLKNKGHKNYEFVDVAVNTDNLIFIDPCLINSLDTELGEKAREILKSYFDELFDAYITENEIKKIQLLSHATEPNGTKLGYGSSNNGKGNTAEGLLNDFMPLEHLIHEIKTIEEPQDLSILIPGFAEDGLSDLITNVLHDILNEFTCQQMKKFGVESNGFVEYYAWNTHQCCWELNRKPGYLVNGKELILVPKAIVRKRYLFNTGQFFSRVILERIREDGGYFYNGKPIPKKDVLKSLRFSGEHWMYDQVISYCKRENDVLLEYHMKLPSFYDEPGRAMTDTDLDECIYNNVDLQTA